MAEQPPPLPPGLQYLAVVQPLLKSLIVAHSFTILYAPLLFCLFFFSTQHIRRQPIFILNVLVILLAVVAGILVDYQAIHTILNTQPPIRVSTDMTISLLGLVQSFFVDSILLVRLFVIFPRKHTGTVRLALIAAVPIFIKIARFINFVLFAKYLVSIESNPMMLASVTYSKPYLKIEWFLQLFDNTYASILFLWKLWLGKKSHNQSHVDSNNSSTYSRHPLQTLFYIAVENFVFPATFSLIELVLVYAQINITTLNEIVLVNTNIAVIGVVFATVWAGTSHSPWAAERRGPRGVRVHVSPGASAPESEETADDPTVSTMMFAEAKSTPGVAGGGLAPGRAVSNKSGGSVQEETYPFELYGMRGEHGVKELSSDIELAQPTLSSDSKAYNSSV